MSPPRLSAALPLQFKTPIRTTSPIDLRVDFYRSDGTWLGKKDGGETNLPAWGFRQLNEVFGAWGTVADGYAVVKTTTPGGRFLAFATVIDNHNSGDPVFIPAALASPAAGPSPSPTPTRTPAPTPTRTPTPTPTVPPSGMDLAPYKPTGWENPLVPDFQAGKLSTSFLSAHMTTFVRWAVANYGTADIPGTIRFELRIDGTRYTGWRKDDGLKAGSYTWFEDYAIPSDTLTPGTHTLTIVADYDNAVSESNESNNSWGKSWEWTAILFKDPESEETLARPAPPMDREDLPLAASRPVEGPASRTALLAAVAGPVYVPAAAHSTGLNGANWLTDLEVHNPGTTAATYTVTLLRQGTDNASGAPSKPFSLSPQQSVRYVDVVSTLFGEKGGAAIRITPQSGTILANSRTYNLIGANTVGLPVGASFGQFVPALPETEAIAYGEEGRIIQLTHREASALTDFRTNVGFVNTTGSPLDLRIDLFTAEGVLLGTVQNASTHLRAFESAQINGIFGTQIGRLEDGYAVLRTTTPGGRFFAYATVIDNHLTGDPVFVPAVKMPGTTPPSPTPTPGPTGDVVSGPAGTTIAIPTGARTGGATPTVSSADTSGLAAAGETVVSTAVKVSVTGTEPMSGKGSFFVTLPVTGSVPDPAKLVLKVQLADGMAYPVAGVYDAVRKSFTAELMALWSGWKMAVVSSAGLTTVLPQSTVEPLGWVTPDDWKTCAFSVANHEPTVPALFATTTLPAAMKKVCGELRAAGFRSPKLWIDTRLQPNARVIHLVRGVRQPNQPNAPPPINTHFEPCWNPGDPTCDEESPAFSMAGLTEDQMLALGQIYVNYDEIQRLAANRKVPLEGVLIHELVHGVQAGYDMRLLSDAVGGSRKAYWEGTATVVGHTYESNANGLFGGDVFVRSWLSPQPLDERLDEFTTGYYERQDFFAYVAKRFTGGRMTNLKDLFQDMSDQTDGKFGLSHGEYLVLYRKATDFWLRQFTEKGLSEVYDDFALDRAYRHPEYARLRPSESGLPAHSFDGAVFNTKPTWSPAQQPSFTLPDVKPLSTSTFAVDIPAAARSAGTLAIRIAVANVPLGTTGTRIRIFRERGGVMVSGGRIDVSDASKPVSVPVGADVDAIRVLVTNAALETPSARVVFSVEGVTVSVAPSNVTLKPGANQQFAATVTGSANTAVTWNIVEGAGGSITSAGLYTAPAANGTYHVKATASADPTKSAQATVTVTNLAAVVVTISPTSATVERRGSLKFTATSSVPGGDYDLDFFVQEGDAGGSFGCCDVEGKATYHAPRTKGTYHVVVRSKTDPTKSATATVTVTAAFSYMQLRFQAEGVFSPPQYPVVSEYITCQAPVTMSASTLTCTWDKTSTTERIWGSLRVTLDASLSRIVSFDGDTWKHELDGRTNPDSHFGITGTTVPWSFGGANDEVFEVQGTETCSHVSRVTLAQDGYVLQSYSCPTASILHIELWK